MLVKSLSQFSAIATLSLTATLVQAEAIFISGQVDSATGGLASLSPAGTPLTGSLDFDGQLNFARLSLASFCFSTDVIGSPPGSAACPAGSSPTPIFAQGQTVYDGIAHPAGTAFEQPGSSFDGTSGSLSLMAYSVTALGVFPIDIQFESDLTGTWNIDHDFLGTLNGSFNWVGATAVPVPAAAWLFGSSLIGLAGLRRQIATPAA